MADGAGGLGGLGGTLFDAAKPLGQPLKSAGQQIVQQVTGQQVGQTKPQGGTFTPPPSGGSAPGLPGLDDFGDFSKLFEKNQMGGKKPPPTAPSQSQNMTPQQLQQMQSQQDAIDAQKIANLTQELHGLMTKPVMNSGEEALKKQQEYMENLRKEDDEKDQADKEQKAAQVANSSAPGQMKPGEMTDLGPVQSQSSSSSPITSAQRSGEAKHTE